MCIIFLNVMLNNEVDASPAARGKKDVQDTADAISMHNEDVKISNQDVANGINVFTNDPDQGLLAYEESRGAGTVKQQ